MGVREAQLSIVFVTDREIKSLNKKFLQRNHSTDVLAFDLKEHSMKGVLEIDGEIVISATTAYSNAKRFGTSSYEELILYVIHGILHLLGYGDRSSCDKQKMRNKEQELLRVAL